MSQVRQEPVVAVARPVATARRGINRDRLISILLISPSVVAVAIFIYGFIGQTAYVSLVRWNDFTPDYTWVGLKNYVDLFHNNRFQIGIGNTVIFTVMFIVACLFLGLLLASLLDMGIKG